MLWWDIPKVLPSNIHILFRLSWKVTFSYCHSGVDPSHWDGSFAGFSWPPSEIWAHIHALGAFPKDHLHNLGKACNCQQHSTLRRNRDIHLLTRISSARLLIYKKNYVLDGVAVKHLLDEHSLVPTSMSCLLNFICKDDLIDFSECISGGAWASQLWPVPNACCWPSAWVWAWSMEITFCPSHMNSQCMWPTSCTRVGLSVSPYGEPSSEQCSWFPNTTSASGIVPPLVKIQLGSSPPTPQRWKGWLWGTSKIFYKSGYS